MVNLQQRAFDLKFVAAENRKLKW